MRLDMHLDTADDTAIKRPAAAPTTLPIVRDVPWSELDALARREGEPLFVPHPYYCDDRGWSLMNLLGGALSASGQLNCSTQLPGVVKAWHRHEHQTDFWIVVGGHLKVGVHRASDGASWSMVVGEHRPGVVVIPPPLWHGAATVGAAPATLLYYVTRQYDPRRPDEERRAWHSVPGFPWEACHR